MTKELDRIALTLECPWCYSMPGNSCTLGERKLPKPHGMRIGVAKTEIVFELYPKLLAAAQEVVNIYTGRQGAIELYQHKAELTVALDELKKVVENES